MVGDTSQSFNIPSVATICSIRPVRRPNPSFSSEPITVLNGTATNRKLLLNGMAQTPASTIWDIDRRHIGLAVESLPVPSVATAPMTQDLDRQTSASSCSTIMIFRQVKSLNLASTLGTKWSIPQIALIDKLASFSGSPLAGPMGPPHPAICSFGEGG